MEHVNLKNTNYVFAQDFKHDDSIRTSFNKLTNAVFGFSLENWYQDGFWGDYYVPYALLHNNEVVSNVSINRIEFDIQNERKVGIQIGTVMTDEKYRNQGLNKFILNHIIKEWEGRSDFIYLFANDSVLDFYPKFNFEEVEEYQCVKSINTHPTTSSLKRLNVENKADVALLMETVKMSIPMSTVSMVNNVSLIMFYCMSYKKNSIFYIEELEAIVIADFEGNTLFLNDVFSKEPVALNDLIRAMSNEKVNRVALGFTPLNDTGFEKRLLQGGDTLFMLKTGANCFKQNHWMFPVLSHA
ncbi:MAG: GNAT family N-acetyltransferase [Bacteroidota bacterium]